MTDSHAGNISFRWTSTFFQALQNYGVRHVVISPGSRSTPLTLAAAADDNLNKHVILDERSAAFTALGIGKATNMPALLICTSGTALANYYPAVIEARQSGVPMVLATADRPPNLRATGANQAIDQLHIFGDYPVFFHEVGEPNLQIQSLDRLQILGQQAVTISRQKRGPVHLNFPFRKPLEPEKEFLENFPQNKPDEKTSGIKATSPALHLPDNIQQSLSRAKRPLIIVGPLAPNDNTNAIIQLAEATNSPLVTESPIDHKNVISGFAGFLRNSEVRAELNPDLILRFGFQPTTKSLELGLNDWNPDGHYHFASTHEWQDATYSGADHIAWMGQKLKWEPFTSSTKGNWLEKWKAIEKAFAEHYRRLMEQSSALTDGAVYQELTPQLTAGQFLAVSNSFPARDINLFGQQAANIPIYMNRGVSGIDGVTSTAIGLSLALEKPGVFMTGDLASLHDTNALLNAKKLKYPLVMVIVNNAGGSIFRMLPIEEYKAYFNTYFETPQSVNIRQLAKLMTFPTKALKHYLSFRIFNCQTGWKKNRDCRL